MGDENEVIGADYLDFRGTMRERPPAEIQRLALEHGARVHPQYATEFEHAFSVTWARVPSRLMAVGIVRRA